MSQAPGSHDPIQKATSLTTLRIIWAAQLGGIGIIAIVLTALQFGSAPAAAPDGEGDAWGLGQPLYTLIALAIAVPAAGASFLVKRALRRRAVHTSNKGQLGAAVIVSVAMCEGGAIAGLVLWLLADGLGPLIGAALASAALLAHFPRADALDLEAAAVESRLGTHDDNPYKMQR